MGPPRLPPITALLGDSDTQNTLLCTHREYYPAEELVREFAQLERNPGALEQRRAIERWSKAPLTPSLKQSIQQRLADSDLFARQPLARNETQWQRRRTYWIVVAEPPVQVVPRPPLPPAHVPLPNFGDFVKAESWNPEEVPPFRPSEDGDAWAGPSNPRY
ncbi:hypothetical protein JB92DRAFT_3095253 [Gautieria morchelliformis]|nr:hypothetical protein JB92DRAFT_3095253 [Gautieria morchelliformis]